MHKLQWLLQNYPPFLVLKTIKNNKNTSHALLTASSLQPLNRLLLTRKQEIGRREHNFTTTTQAYVCAGNRKKIPDSRFDDPKKCRFFPVIFPLTTRIPGIETKAPLFSRRKNLCGWFVLWLYSIKVNLSFYVLLEFIIPFVCEATMPVYLPWMWVLKWPHIQQSLRQKFEGMEMGGRFRRRYDTIYGWV